MNQKAMDFNAYIRNVKDFPKSGIVFKDITPLLKDKEAMTAAVDTLYGFARTDKIDKVVGVDSRGFIFAPLLAYKLGVGFVPVRKKGKLPSATLSEEAVCKLAEKLGGEIVQCNLIIHLSFLKGAEKLIGYPVKALLEY